VNERFGPFEAVTSLGHGGMGVVYKARHVETGQWAALKVLPAFLSRDEHFRARFDREASILRRLDHPNIIRLLGAGVEKDVHYYAMELLEGETLLERMYRSAVPETEAVDIARQVLSALDYAHTLPDGGAIHRDIKPENIYLASGAAKLIDYGLSKMVVDATLTVTGSHFGSPAYMAPEQFVDAKTVDHRADLWAVGLTLYSALSGSAPFKDDTSLSILRKWNDPKFTFAPIRSLRPDVSETTANIVQVAMQKDPAKRFQTAREFLDALAGAPHEPRTAPYAFDGRFPLSTFVDHAVFGERGLIVDLGQTPEGLDYIVAEFPSKGRLRLVARQTVAQA